MLVPADFFEASSAAALQEFGEMRFNDTYA